MKPKFHFILKTIFLSALFFLAGLVFPPVAYHSIAPGVAHANITVSPLRVIFDGRTRSAEVMLLNMSTEENTYRIGWVYNKQQENGQYERIDTPLNPDFDPAQFIKFSPRQVTIPPSGRQKVRLSLRKPADLPDGEYRAHMIFQNLPDDNADPSIGPPAEGVSIGFSVTLGFSIPVTVRQGEYDAQVNITNPRFLSPADVGSKETQPFLEITLNRTGKHSTLGRVIVTWDRSEKEGKRVGILNNVSLFPEIGKRITRIPLSENAISGGNLTVTYHGDGPQKGQILAQTVIPVGQ